VRYASRIQETILPDKEQFMKSFADAFIYFHPKDELSGDFYWYSEVNGLKIVACIDCTGHSIPGAFMTVMANTLINNIVKEQKILSPEKILIAMDNGVQNNMNKQTKNAKRQMHDGMDMTICVIDESAKTLTFASANQCLCRVNNGELQYLKGSSFPIGGFQFDEKSYKEEVIYYETSDMFYMYSDGYQDQFGGAEGRKYMSKRFREYLKQISHLTAEAQEAILLREQQMWRGMRTQTDDQLIIGFRL
jgi:serine phosphatase RsbU (regulator of sigma subunit)